LTYNEKLNAVDRLWKFKLGLTIVLILVSIIGIGCLAWAVSTASELRSEYDYGYDSVWALPWGLITFSVSVAWCILCIAVFFIRQRPLHPGARVAMDLLLWLGFIPTALFTLWAFYSLLQWGEYDSLGFSSTYGDYQLEPNNTWVWVPETDYYGTTYGRSCNTSSTSYRTYSYYYTDNPFKNCAEMDAYVNTLWHAKPNRLRTELTATVCQFLAVVLHFALFVWACVDCHRHRRRNVNKDAEKIAAGIVEKMVQSGAVIPPPRQAHTSMKQGQNQPMYYQPSGPGHAQQRGQYSPPVPETENPPPLPPRHQHQHQQAEPSNAKGKGVAESYYEPGRA
jgi:hypothetical protein